MRTAGLGRPDSPAHDPATDFNGDGDSDLMDAAAFQVWFTAVR